MRLGAIQEWLCYCPHAQYSSCRRLPGQAVLCASYSGTVRLLGLVSVSANGVTLNFKCLLSSKRAKEGTYDGATSVRNPRSGGCALCGCPVRGCENAPRDQRAARVGRKVTS